MLVTGLGPACCHEACLACIQAVVYSGLAVHTLPLLLVEADSASMHVNRLAEGTRKAADAWGLKLLCKDPRWRSDSLTVIEVPEVGCSAMHHFPKQKTCHKALKPIRNISPPLTCAA